MSSVFLPTVDTLPLVENICEGPQNNIEYVKTKLITTANAQQTYKDCPLLTERISCLKSAPDNLANKTLQKSAVA